MTLTKITNEVGQKCMYSSNYDHYAVLQMTRSRFFSAASTVTNLISTYIFLFKYLLSGPSGASSSTSIMQSDLQTPIIRTM